MYLVKCKEVIYEGYLLLLELKQWASEAATEYPFKIYPAKIYHLL